MRPRLMAAALASLLMAAALAIGSAVRSSSPPGLRQAVGQREFPITSDGIFVFNDQLSPSEMSEAQLRFAATHYVGSQKIGRSGARQLRRYNPDFLILHYRLGQALGHSRADSDCNPTSEYIQIVSADQWVQEWPGDSQVREEWFFHWNGSRVFNCDWGHYLMDLDDPGWRAWWSAQVIAELEANESDGVFADSFMVPNYGFRWKPPLPEVDAAFEADWARREHEFTDYIRQRFAGRWKWIPNVSGLITTRDPSDYSNVDGVMIEQFAESGHRQWFSPVDWELEMNRLLPLVRADKIIIAQSYPEVSDIEERLFILGSYLLIKGRYSYINLEIGGGSPEWFPEYAIDLGPPRDELPAAISAFLHPAWQVYVRRYAKGMVLVNPTEAVRSIHLDREYHQAYPRGGGWVPENGVAPGSLEYRTVRELSLGPHSAAVLLEGTETRPAGS